MKDAFAIGLDLLLALAAALFPVHKAASAPASIETDFTARVIHVDDGDTVVALKSDMSKVKVRLANIDAPEVSHGNCRPGQPWSGQATQALKDLVLGQSIRFTCSTLDRYGRSVCDLNLSKSPATTANRELTKMGLVWANRANPSYLRDPAVAAAEREAQARHLGLWSVAGAIAPWEWRQNAWKQPGCEAQGARP